MSRSVSRCAGFNLVELLAVMALTGLLVALVFPAVSRALEAGRIAQVRADLRTVEAGLELYFADHQRYPPVSVSCNAAERAHWCQLPVELVAGNYLPPGDGPMSTSLQDPFSPGHTYKYAAIVPYRLNGVLQKDNFAMFVPDNFPTRDPSSAGRYWDDSGAPLLWAVWSLGPRMHVSRGLHPHAPASPDTWYAGTGDHGVIARLRPRESSAIQVP